jgi:signal transduction histidine kinase
MSNSVESASVTYSGGNPSAGKLPCLPGPLGPKVGTADHGKEDLRWIAQFADLMLSRDPKRRIRLVQTGLALLIMLSGVGTMQYMAWAGFASWRAVVPWTISCVVVYVGFFCVIRSGWSERFADPAMTMAQMAYAIASCAFAYAMAGAVRGAVIPPVMVVLIFGMFALRPRQLLAISIYAVALFGAVMWAMSQAFPEAFSPAVELSYFLILASMMPMVAMLAGKLSQLRSRLKQQKSDLRDAFDRLQDAQAQLLNAARLAGMAEIATNVLHNVGNILNSVNVSVELVSSTLRHSRAQGLSQAVQLMHEHAADLGDFLSHDARGQMLPAYLGQLAQALALEQQGMVEELRHLTCSIDHIKDVVAIQQTYAGGTASVVEPVQLCDLADDALRMSSDALQRHQVSVVREFSQVPVAQIDRARVLQILVNLISNAGHAMESVPGPSRQLTLRVESVASKHLRVSVRDEGEGIPADNLTRIFVHGFTTRKTGHGFGLHSCALAARQMGGTLTAHSDGPGRGATFTLEIPINTQQGEP